MCDVAQQTLIDHGLEPALIDIDRDESLRDQFDTCVPVVEIDGKVRFRGKVDHLLLKRLLRNQEGQQS